MDFVVRTRKGHPVEKANCISRILFAYVVPLFIKGSKKNLTVNDLYEAPAKLQSKALGDRIETEWKFLKKHGKNSVVLLLWRCFGLQYFLIGLMTLFIKIILIALQPMALGKFIAYFTPNQTEVTYLDAVLYAVLTVALIFVDNLTTNNFCLLQTEIGIRARTAICSLIYRKILKSRPNDGDSDNDNNQNGRILTLITKDVESFDNFVTYANDMWTGIIKSFIALAVVYTKLGYSALGPAIIFVLTLPIYTILTIYSIRYRISVCKETDNRLQITKEAVSSIKLVKMYGIEKFYEEKINKARQEELRKTSIFLCLNVGVNVLGEITRHLCFYSVLITFNDYFTSDIFYFIWRCYQHVTVTFSNQFPTGLNAIAEFYAATKRIGKILNQVDSIRDPHIQTTPKIRLDHVTMSINHDDILRNINLDLKAGLTILTGPTGSGKSALLKTIARIYPINKGSLKVAGRVSYASQTPWLFPSTVRQNILFGEQYNHKRYKDVIRICALKHDFEQFPNGDETIVEDNGQNFSGGQQARINLARAIYRQADIYLLDNCLSALDVQVADYIFKECVLKFLHNKLVVLVSNSQLNGNHCHIIIDNGTIIKDCNQQKYVDEKTPINNDTNNDDDNNNNNNNNNNNDKVDIHLDNDNEEDTTDSVNQPLIEKKTNQVIYNEKNKSGQVDFRIYWRYIQLGGGIWMVILILSIFVFGQLTESFEDISSTIWIEAQDSMKLLSENSTNSTEYLQLKHDSSARLMMNVGLKGSQIVTSILKAIFLFIFILRISRNLNKLMIGGILRAIVRFFDETFIGVIMNRFSKDLNTIDELLPFTWYHYFTSILLLISTTTVILIYNTKLILPIVILTIVLVVFRWFYLRTGRNLKRLDASTRSPVVGYIGATLNGLSTIQALQMDEILIDEFDRHQSLYASTTYTLYTTMRGFMFYLQTICTLFIGVVMGSFTVFSTGLAAGRIGLTVSQALLLSEKLEIGIRLWSDTENQMTSVERSIEFTEIKQENRDGLILEKFIKSPTIRYNNVSLKYGLNTREILRKITFSVDAHEKIAIVGRTGAGKSSLISTIFRLYDIEGSIIIDGVDIKTLSIDLLRSKISIIPQQPFLFTGTIRENIDPLNQYNDERIWNVLSIVHLESIVKDLNQAINDNDNYFSVGQKQLICIARALIRDNKIVILDEATANIDDETAKIVQTILKNNFTKCTLMAVTHNISTALNYDRIIVINDGEIVEFDTTDNLLNNTNGFFYKMVTQWRLSAEQSFLQKDDTI